MSNFHSPMKCIPSNARVLTPKPQVQQTLDLKQAQHKAKRSITWFFVNSFVLSIIVFDLFYGSTMYKPLCWIEYFLASITSLNALYHLVQYLAVTFTCQPIVLSPRQRRLLGISEDDPMFKSSPSLPPKCQEPTTPINYSCMNISRRSNTLVSPGLNESQDYSSPSSLYKYNASCKLTPSSNSSFNKTINTSFNGSLTSEDLIQDEEGLESYLKEVAQQEKKFNHSKSVDQPSNLLSSFWSHSATRSPNEVSPLLRKCAYQLAPTTDKSKSSSPHADEGSSPRGHFGVPDVWRKYRIDPIKVNQWTANLRMWISKTVVERVANEIDYICAALVRHGLSDSQPGHVGLEKLRKLAQSPFIVSAIPTFSTLVPFLELSNNQDYLVKRIKVLAKGGSMSEFKWNGGGSHAGKEWDSSLPTDTAIIMHLVASYMDTQLEAPLDQPDARPFSSRYMAKAGTEMPRSKGPIIVCQSTIPPHYYLALTGESTPAEVEEIPRGRNNLFHTLLLFLYLVQTRDHGMLGRVNLGMSGVNVLWVINE